MFPKVWVLRGIPSAHSEIWGIHITVTWRVRRGKINRFLNLATKNDTIRICKSGIAISHRAINYAINSMSVFLLSQSRPKFNVRTNPPRPLLKYKATRSEMGQGVFIFDKPSGVNCCCSLAEFVDRFFQFLPVGIPSSTQKSSPTARV